MPRWRHPAEHGGYVTDHNSHQSGRDVDLGLFYKKKPPGYPNSFIDGTERNLDAAATWTLISKLASTAGKDGGVWVIFLDHEVQRILYRWAKDHGVSEKRLEKVLQYPHGRGASAGIVRHYRNHAHHIHARFKCTKAETSCR
jgi:murein endopeptidase